MFGTNTTSFNEDDLLLERLDIFLEKSLDDLREFARREGRDFDQIRLRAAEWHSKYLFDATSTTSYGSEACATAQAIVNDVLDKTSRSLESLQTVAGRHSLLLVVDPTSPDDVDEGFLGGTVTGREFWRGLRNGGVAGARNFKEFCRRASGFQSNDQGTSRSSLGAKQSPAGTMKNKLYAEMRSRLRAVSGVRNAEMKWTKPEKLSVYGVVLEGWPRNIEYKNPSKMSFNETSTLMKLLLENKMHFRSLRENASTLLIESPGAVTSSTADVSWALNEDDHGSAASRADT